MDDSSIRPPPPKIWSQYLKRQQGKVRKTKVWLTDGLTDGQTASKLRVPPASRQGTKNNISLIRVKEQSNRVKLVIPCEASCRNKYVYVHAKIWKSNLLRDERKKILKVSQTRWPRSLTKQEAQEPCIGHMSIMKNRAVFSLHENYPQYMKLLLIRSGSIWSIFQIKSDLKWCIHLSRSLFLYLNYLVSVTAGHGGPRSPRGHM